MRYAIGIVLALLVIVVTLYFGLGTSVHPCSEATYEDVTYPSGRETLRGSVQRPFGPGPFPAVVLVHGDTGAKDEQIKAMAKLGLGDRGYLALMVDLYRGQEANDLMDAHIMSRGLPDNQVLDDLKAAVDYL